MEQRRWTARDVIALLLAASMTSSACSSGCRSNNTHTQAADSGTGQGEGTPAPSSPAAAAGAAVPTLDAAATGEALAYIEQVVKLSAGAAPDLTTQATALGKDPTKIFAFVRSDIRYQVYDGVLRGAEGALSGRAANSWDTALLVAELLRKGGSEVRFARATLSEAAASALVNRMFDQAMQPARQPRSADGLQPPAAAAGVADAMRQRIETNWTTNTAGVMAALKKAGIALGTEPPVSDATLLAEARDHVWVEYKDGLQWIPVDPVAATKIGEAPTKARETLDTIPDSKQHVVTIALNVEQRAGATIEAKPALTLRAPAAELHGQAIMLAHQLDIAGSGAWKATPVLLVGDRALGGTAYGPGGIQSADNSGAGGIGSRLNQMFGGAPTAAAEMTAVWLDVTMSSPDGRSETARREVLDRVGPVARAARSEATAPLRPVALDEGRPVSFTAVMACAVTAGPLSAAILASRVAAVAPILRDEALRARLVRGDTTGVPDDRLRQIGIAAGAALAVLPQTAHLLSQQYAAEAAPAFGQPVLLYETSPRLAIAAVGRYAATDSPAGHAISLDLRRNALRVVGRGVPPASLIASNITRGVLDGAIEDALVAGEGTVVSTVGVLAEARAKGATIAASSAASMPATGWSDEARARMHAGTPAASIVVAPTSSVSLGGGSRVAWWRIDIATGETAGVLDSGLNGSEWPSNAVLLVFVAGMAAQAGFVIGTDVAIRVVRAALAFIDAAGPGAANAGKKGWEAAKKTL